MFELKNVTKFYNNNGVVTMGLHNINLKLERGEIVAITGESGSGKSTLLNVICGVDTYEEGEILYYGNETSYFNQDDMDLFRKNHVSFIYQKYNIIDSYTVLENVMVPLLLQGKTKKEAKADAIKLIEEVGLSKRINNKGTELSGGEKQRCVIARALASPSQVLACDEPTGNLDSKTGSEIIELIKKVSHDKLVLIVTHNYEQVKDIVTRKIKLSDGEIIEDKKIEEIKEEKEVNHELDLEKRRVNKKTLFGMSFRNIFSTPKKTIFTSMIFFVISLITLVLGLLIVNVSYNVNKTSSSDYILLDKDRIVVYNLDHSPLDINKLQEIKNVDEIIENPFFEETKLHYETIEHSVLDLSLITEKIDYKLVKGKEMTKEGDFIVLLPKRYDAYWIDEVYQNDLNLRVDKYLNSKSLVGYVTGVGVSNEIKSPALLSYSPNPTKLINTVINTNTSNYYLVDGKKEEIKTLDFQTEFEEKTKIMCPLNLKDKISFKYMLDDLYEVKYNDIEIVYTDDATYLYPTIIYGKDYYQGLLTPILDNIYEASIYTSNKNMVKKELTSLGYNYTIPTEIKGEKEKVDLITLYTFMILLVIALTGLFFISFAIMSKIYASKTKDYGILRALGLVKHDLGLMVKIETITIGMSSSILALILFIVISIIIPKIGLINYMGIFFILFYFVSIFVFSYLIASKFNKKLFNNSLQKKIKEGEIND